MTFPVPRFLVWARVRENALLGVVNACTVRNVQYVASYLVVLDTDVRFIRLLSLFFVEGLCDFHTLSCVQRQWQSIIFKSLGNLLGHWQIGFVKSPVTLRRSQIVDSNSRFRSILRTISVPDSARKASGKTGYRRVHVLCSNSSQETLSAMKKLSERYKKTHTVSLLLRAIIEKNKGPSPEKASGRTAIRTCNTHSRHARWSGIMF